MEIEQDHMQVDQAASWVVVEVNDRIDSFNFSAVKDRIELILEEGRKHVAFDLARTNFLSMPGIHLLSSVASSLKRQGGKVALVAPSEKLKRQIEIYASLNDVQLLRSTSELPDFADRS